MDSGDTDTAAGPLQRLAERPRLFQLPGFLGAEERQALIALCADEPGLEAAGVVLRRDLTGTSCELPLPLHPELARLAQRLEATLGIPNALAATLRMRRYGVGQGHPAHVDTYRIAGHELVATALVCLVAPTDGGETVFMDAEAGPIACTHTAGQLLAWHNLTSDGTADSHSLHLGAPVREGEKLVLSWFVYADVAALAAARTGRRATDEARAACRQVPPERRTGALRGFGRLLAIVDDGVPPETVSLLRHAAADRGVRTTTVSPNRFDFAPERALRDGDMIYRPAVSMHALRVEQHLWHPRVASFHRDPDGPLFSNVNATVTFARAGIPVPRTFWLATADRDLLRTMVDGLGGLPVVVKALGYSRGVGVIRCDSLPGLFSVVDFALAEGNRPLLTTYVPDAVHWRLVVVGDRAVASYRNVTDPDDFRTSGSSDPSDYAATPPPGAEDLAVRSCHALRTDHGGVDILEHPSGRLYVLEANSPCYYAQAQLEGGVDVAGAMLDHLLERAEALAPPSDDPLPSL